MRVLRPPPAIGSRFGSLTILAEKRRGYRRVFVVQCVCRKIKSVLSQSLVSGRTTNCGCISNKVGAEKRKKHGESKGASRTKEFRAWSDAIGRCRNPNNRSYKNYGGRGISVCDRWLESYENFLADMGRAPSKEMTLERVNNDLGYAPDNCVWATRKQQSENKRNANLRDEKGRYKSAETN